MTKIIAICLALALSGCANMTPGQKTAAWVVAGVAVTAVALSSSDSNSTAPPCKLQDGSESDSHFRCR